MNSDARLRDREVVATRVVAAPRDVVFKAWTQAEPLACWWGPAGFRNTFDVFEPWPGGAWRFVMHGPDGVDYPNESRFVELVEPELIVIDHVSPPRFRLEADLAAVEDGTQVTFRQIFETASVCEAVKSIVIPANEQNLDRLEAQIARMRGQPTPAS